jgi:hypothetical protein
LTLTLLGLGLAASASAELNDAPAGLKTATPIKHLVVVIGENRSFDHIYATYVPGSRYSILTDIPPIPGDWLSRIALSGVSTTVNRASRPQQSVKSSRPTAARR